MRDKIHIWNNLTSGQMLTFDLCNINRNIWGKCLGKLSGRGWGRKECWDPENQFSFIRKTYKQLIFAIVQAVETFLNIRIRFQPDFNHISIMMCNRQVRDCCNLSPIHLCFTVSIGYRYFLKNYIMEFIVAIYRTTTLFVEI